jgi:hypothetical protein
MNVKETRKMKAAVAAHVTDMQKTKGEEKKRRRDRH